MARVAINTGSVANDGTGDTLRAAGGIINDNFLEIYAFLGAGSSTVLSAPIWNTTDVGINTLRNVGVGTTNPTSTLTVLGDTLITGVVTALSFDGNLTSNYWIRTDVGINTISSVGIGTTNPGSKLTVYDGDISVGIDTSNGIILTSPNGTRYRLIVLDDGSISSTQV